MSDDEERMSVGSRGSLRVSGRSKVREITHKVRLTHQTSFIDYSDY